jgi:hypothetical protein
MKMKYEDLSPLRIDIQTKNDKHFLELAILFDKPDFLEWLPKIRKKYALNRLIPLDEYGDVTSSFQTSKLEKFDLSIYKDIEGLVEYANENTRFGDYIDSSDLDLLERLDTDANILCYIFNRPPYFSDSIKQAILCGSTDGLLFDPTFATLVEGDMILSTTGSFQLPQVAILVSPTSTDIEIKEQVAIARQLLKTDEKLAYYKPRVDKVNKIRAYREWYWQHLAGKTYVQISTEWMDSLNISSTDSGSDDNRILKGVAYYKKLLST